MIDFAIIIISVLSKISFTTQLPEDTKLFYNFNETNEDILIKCAFEIITTNFEFTPTILIDRNSQEDDNYGLLFQRKLTNKLMANEIPMIVSQNYVNASLIYMQKEYILSISYYVDCENLSILQNKTIEDHIMYLVIVFDYSKEKCYSTLEKIGQDLSMYDVTFVIPDAESGYNILTFVPELNVTTCVVQYNVQPTILSLCGSDEIYDVFPQKYVRNYMKCPLNIGVASLFPFASMKNKTALKTFSALEEDEFDGSDKALLKVTADYFNFTPQFYFINKSEENPFIDMNFLKFILNGSFDLCAGGLYRVYGDKVDYSGVYGRQAIVWMYPATRTKRSWQNFVRKVNGLYVFMIFYFVYSLIWKLFCIFDKQTVSIGRMLLHTWGALIGTSSLNEGITLKQKILNLVYSIMCIHLSAYISIQMFSFLTILSPPTIYKTNTDIIESGLRPFLTAQGKYFMSDNAYEAFANTSLNCETFIDCEEKSLEYNGVTAVLDGQFIPLQAETAVNDEAITLKVNENLLTIYHEMLLRNDLPITESFQKTLLRLCESGISDHFYDEAIGIVTISKSESANKNMMTYSYSCVMGCSITLGQSAGAFYLWIIGCGLSFCVFIIEVVLKRERNAE